jgi:hypothetical protein
MYQFWLNSFILAKNWGIEPPRMNHHITQQVRDYNSLPSSSSIHLSPPGVFVSDLNGPAMSPRSSQQLLGGATRSSIPKMSSLCSWAIHVGNDLDYERLPEVQPVPVQETPPQTIPTPSFPDVILESLQTNSFSDIGEESLPVSLQFIKEAPASQSSLFSESVGFAIMARNIELLESLLEKAMSDHDLTDQIYNLHPFHLAATYLDGAKSCCLVIEALTFHFEPRELYINDSHHTILDILFLNVVRCHTGCKPRDFDASFKSDEWFKGEELDICGRWDADSESLIRLFRNGRRTIPASWKHKFCHTSAHAICHVISMLFESSQCAPPNINQASGLCSTMCTNCGTRMELTNLHVLVLVALRLSVAGRPDEDLFGILAISLCLLSNGADPSRAIQIPTSFYKDVLDDTACNHVQLTPADLCQQLIPTIENSISTTLRTGWNLIYWILKQSAMEWILGEPEAGVGFPRLPLELKLAPEHQYNLWKLSSIEPLARVPCRYLHCYDITLLPDYEESCSEDLNWFLNNHEKLDCGMSLLRNPQNFFGHNSSLSTLWAAAQTELLTYRRLSEGDRWVSPDFDMDSLLSSLRSGHGVNVRLLTENRMKDFCKCGRFVKAPNPVIPVMTHVSNYYFSNMEDGKKATYLSQPYYEI